LIILSAAGCARMDSSVKVTPSNDPLITNGVACDYGVIDTAGYRKLVVPENAVVSVSAARTCRIVMEKELSMFAHPDVAISIYERRRTMGCAYRDDDGILFLATYGECATGGHGGTVVRLKIETPKGIIVEKRPKLEREKGDKANYCSGNWTYPLFPGGERRVTCRHIG